MTASTRKVTDGAAKAHAAARAAKSHVEAAQKHADAIAAGSTDVIQKLEAIIKAAPPELQPSLVEVKTAVLELQQHDQQLQTELAGARAKHDELEQHQMTLDSDISQLKIDQGSYHVEANGLAIDATNEREARIKVETKLSWYRWHWWGSWVVFALGVLACGAWAVIKFGIKLKL